MKAADGPYLYVTHSMRRGWGGWLEFPADMTDHAALADVADRLCRDFGAVVTERYPEDADDGSKEYWRLQVGADELLLMRKPPGVAVGLCVASGDFGTLLRICRAWGIERAVGWRWRAWQAWRRAISRRIS